MTQEHGSRTGRAAIALSVLALLASTAISVREWRRLAGEAVETERAAGIQRQARTLLTDVAEAESGERGFLLTGQSDYLAAHEEAAARIPSTLERLARHAASDPAAARRVDALAPLVGDKLDEMRRTIQVRRTKGLAAALDIMRTGQGKDLMERIRSICLSIEEEQRAVSERSWSGLRGSASRARWVVLAGGTIAAALAAAGGWVLCRAGRRN